jgi:hypothetical protein
VTVSPSASQSAEILFESYAYNQDKLVWVPAKILSQYMLPKGFTVDGCEFEQDLIFPALLLLLLLLVVFSSPILWLRDCSVQGPSCDRYRVRIGFD